MSYLGNPVIAIDVLIPDTSIAASKLIAGVAASNLGFAPYNQANILNTPTGVAIASAASINLNTATGNLVHVTGTTTITTVLLSTGFRTVVFDGVLTLTHNSVTNKLPGGVSITTAVGDVAIYESDGTTVYCTNYTKVSGAAVVAAASGDQIFQFLNFK